MSSRLRIRGEEMGRSFQDQRREEPHRGADADGHDLVFPSQLWDSNGILMGFW